MTREQFRTIFLPPKPIIGMIHVFSETQKEQIRQALEDLERLQQWFVDGVIIENYDWGYADTNCATRKTLGIMLQITREVMRMAEIPVGVNLLPNDFEGAFIICRETGAQFLQLDFIVDKLINNEGTEVEPVNLEEYRWYRKNYPRVTVLGGVHPKYYTLRDSSVTIGESAKRARELCDAVVVTGEETGGETRIKDLQLVREAISDFPLLVGSGLSVNNCGEQLAIADAAIVGSAFKRRGVIHGEPIDESLAKALYEKVVSVFR